MNCDHFARFAVFIALTIALSSSCSAGIGGPELRCAESDDFIRTALPQSQSNLTVALCLPRGLVIHAMPGGEVSEGILQFVGDDGLSIALSVVKPTDDSTSPASDAKQRVRMSELYGLTLTNPPLAAEHPIKRNGVSIGSYIEVSDTSNRDRLVKHFGAFASGRFVVVFDAEYNQSPVSILDNILQIELHVLE